MLQFAASFSVLFRCCFLLLVFLRVFLMALDQNAHQLMSTRWKQFKQCWSGRGEPLSLMVALRAASDFCTEALSAKVAQTSWARVGAIAGHRWDRDVLFVTRSAEIFSSQRGQPELDKVAASSALTALKQVSPSKTKCSNRECGQFLQENMRLCWNCGKENDNFDQKSFEIHKRGYRSGWQDNAQLKLSALSPAEEKMLSQVDDVMKEMSRRAN